MVSFHITFRNYSQETEFVCHVQEEDSPYLYFEFIQVIGFRGYQQIILFISVGYIYLVYETDLLSTSVSFWTVTFMAVHIY